MREGVVVEGHVTSDVVRRSHHEGTQVLRRRVRVDEIGENDFVQAVMRRECGEMREMSNWMKTRYRQAVTRRVRLAMLPGSATGSGRSPMPAEWR